MMNHEELFEQVMVVCDTMSAMEEELALEWYGCTYDELDEDERAEITMEMYDRLS